MAKQSTADYYRTHPDAAKNRLKQQSAYQKTAKGKAIKKAANAANRAKGTYGNGDGLDVSHKPGKEGSRKAKDVTLQSPSKNRKSRLKIGGIA
tara:strand:- start:39 stop:317 length:279 start_codon:yes stop_codon:yes gene_type:complete